MNSQKLDDKAVKMRPELINKAPATATFRYPNRRKTGPPKNDRSMPSPWFRIITRDPCDAVRPVSSKASWKTNPKADMRGSTTT